MQASGLEFSTIKSDFIQTITNDQNTSIVYKGTFYATKDAKALWIYDTPVEKKIYFNNNKVTIIEPMIDQVIITTLKNSPNITAILQSAKKIDENMFEAMYEGITYTVFLAKLSIEKIQYNDQLDNNISIILENQATDIFLDDLLFEANIPKSFDIITQ